MVRRRWRDDVQVFIKQRPGSSPAAYAFEAAGLAWLREVEGGCPVPWVRDVGTDRLTMDFVTTSPPSVSAARNFGTQLALTHAAGAEAYGQRPPGAKQAFIAELSLPDGEWETFGSFYAQARIQPLLDQAAPHLTPQETEVIGALVDALETEDSRLIGGAEPIARLHGDLWSGNVLWRRRDCVLIDPSAHGGHRESDLAMLALFGFPHLDDVIEAYHGESPLASGWEQRIPLHQVYPLLVHTILFGGTYGSAAAKAARSALAV